MLNSYLSGHVQILFSVHSTSLKFCPLSRSEIRYSLRGRHQYVVLEFGSHFLTARLVSETGSVMTDGAGSIGRQLAFDIDRHFGWSKSTAFQVRINGTKVSRDRQKGYSERS